MGFATTSSCGQSVLKKLTLLGGSVCTMQENNGLTLAPSKRREDVYKAAVGCFVCVCACQSFVQVEILDVVSPDTCMCRTDQGKLLEGKCNGKKTMKHLV